MSVTNWVYRHPGLHGVVFQAIQKPLGEDCPDNWYESPEFAQLWPKDGTRVNEIIDELVSLRRNNERGFKICNPVGQLQLFKRYFSNPAGFVKPFRCHLGTDVMQVDAFGNLILCNAMGFVGNIKESGIEQLWYSQEAGRTREQIHNCAKNCYHLVNCFYDGDSDA